MMRLISYRQKTNAFVFCLMDMCQPGSDKLHSQKPVHATVPFCLLLSAPYAYQ